MRPVATTRNISADRWAMPLWKNASVAASQGCASIHHSKV
jgi:hypothetical protein